MHKDNDLHKPRDLITHPSEIDQARYVDWLRNQGPKPDEALLNHVATCEQCQSELIELAELGDTIDGEEKVKGPKRLSIVWRSAAAIVLVLLGALAIQFIKDHGAEKSHQQTNRYSNQNVDNDVLDEPVSNAGDPALQADTLLFAANFQPNKALNSLIEASFRSNEHSVVIFWPSDTVLYKPFSITTELKVPDGHAQFILYNNRGFELTRTDLNETYLTLEQDLEPGLYYWKVLNNSELMQVGLVRLYRSRN